MWNYQGSINWDNVVVTGPTLDADGDGLMNLLEYAIGTNGFVHNSNPQVVEMATMGTDKYLRITLPKNSAATDVVVVVEATSDLKTWSSEGLVIVSNTSTQLVVRDSVPVSGDTHRFMRVRVMRP
jgi:hypothetical protein